MGSPEPPRWKDDMGDYHDPVPPDGTRRDDSRLPLIRQVFEDEQEFQTGRYWAAKYNVRWLIEQAERVDQLEQDAKKWERADSEHVRAARFEQERANAAVERVTQLEQENERLFLQDAEHRAMYVKEYDKVNQLEQALRQIAHAPPQEEVDPYMLIRWLRRKARETLSAAGEDAK